MAGTAVSDKNIHVLTVERGFAANLRTGRRMIGGTQSRALFECYGIILKRK
jgi:hypothetical protein